MLAGTLSRRLLVVPLITALFAAGCGASAVTPLAPAAGGGATGGPVTPKVNRLVIMVNPPPNEFNDIRKICCFDVAEMRPMYENLIGIDAKTAKYTPQLALSWSLEPNNAGVRFKLRQGVQFNRGYGEMTAKDVAYSWQDLTKDLPKAVPNTFAPWWKRTFKEVTVVNDYEAVFQFTQPDSTFFDLVSESAGQLPIRPKAQFDKEGELGETPAKPVAGTGPYDFKERQFGNYIRYDRVAGKHWRVTPEFPELEFRYSKEPSVRLAALLAGEVHISTMSDDLMPSGERAGMKVVRGTVPGTRSWGVWICCGRTESGEFYRDNTSPLLNVKVRQALNKAIDRDALQKAFFPKGERMYISHMHQSWPGWDKGWEARFSDLYGYDVAKAKALLAEAGYGPGNPLKTNVGIRVSTTIANAPDVEEAIAQYWRAAGVDVNMITTEVAQQTAEVRAFKWTNHFYVDASSTVQLFAWPNRASDLFTWPGQGGNNYFDRDTNVINEKLMREMNEDKQAKLMHDLGELNYTRFGSVPLFFMPVEALYNPQVVKEWTFPGPLWAAWTHTEYIKAAG